VRVGCALARAVINAFVRGIRTTDVLGGVDARTHYFGLVSEP